MTHARSSALVEDGFTYRQIDYWVNCGYLRPLYAGLNRDRRWTVAERAVARRMLALVNAGMQVSAAATIARKTPGTVQLADGITLYVEGPS